MLILLHSSKSMKASGDISPETQPEFLPEAKKLSEFLQSLDKAQLADAMKLSEKKTEDVYSLIHERISDSNAGVAAIEAFVGDIYSGLQVPQWNQENLEYAQENLRILSGLYGLLKPLDEIHPYRLEMGYKFDKELPGGRQSMYEFWGDKIANALPSDDLVINLTAEEYSRTIKEELKKRNVIEPKFLTVSSKTGKPRQVIVHTKIARGAFARWLIEEEPDDLTKFSDIGYKYDGDTSTENQPVFIAKEFQGKGMSVR